MTESGLTISQGFKGLALPMVRVPGGYFQSKNELDTAWGDLMQAVLTPIGSRPFARDFGSRLHEVIFEPEGQLNAPLIRETIRSAAETWAPHVLIYDIFVEDQGKSIAIEISFSLASSADKESRLIRVSREGQLEAVGLDQ